MAVVNSANKIRLWNKDVDSESFHPRFRSHEMRIRLTPLIVHVGRFESRKVWISSKEKSLKKMFLGMSAVYTGMLGGEELSQAYICQQRCFVMHSESETLGLVVLEAMPSGILVTSACAGGILDIIHADQEGKIGFLFSPGDLKDCLSKLWPLFFTTRN